MGLTFYRDYKVCDRVKVLVNEDLLAPVCLVIKRQCYKVGCIWRLSYRETAQRPIADTITDTLGVKYGGRKIAADFQTN